MGVNIYYLELMFIFTQYLLAVKIDEKVILTETLFLRRKDKKHQEKNFVVNLLHLIRVVKAMMQTMKLVDIIKNIKKIKEKFKRTRRENRKIDRSNHSIK